VTNYLVTGAHASGAEDTLVVVTNKRRVAIIYRKHVSASAQSVNALWVYAQIASDLKQFTILTFGAGEAIGMMIGDDKFHADAS
jgi:hypothetical protein